MGERINAANFPIDGDVVRDLRTKSDLSLGQLAGAAGLSKATISLVENGRTREISQAAASRLAEALGIKKELIQSNSRTPKSLEDQALRRRLLSLRADLVAFDREVARYLDSDPNSK